ncbi:MAG TPA: carboxypeptidase regulatory-like domain-containing protein [Terriglobales bacterium]|nr:carboxypeptidase regulatory-like domain-containing protein [Terriglobales bacterium]
MRSKAKAVRLWVLGFCVPLLSLCVLSQTYTGRILGNVTDQTGAWVTGATVTITDAQRGTTRTLSTDTSGLYVAPDLSPGVYNLRVEAKGFKSMQRVNVPLEVAKDVRIDFSLQAGQVSEVIEVSGEVPLLDTTSSTLGGTLSNVEITDLPLNGRNYENLLQLRPGVMRYPGGGFSTTSANGLRAEDNAYLVEGLYNSEPYSGQAIINGAGIAGDSATILPIDSVQEFNTQQNPPAEYGWKPGAVVNVGLKSGTNTLHGTAFAFGRDGVMDARNYFNAAPNPKLPRTLEQFGGSLGGPIIKNKAFFFGAYEGQRYNVGNSFGGVTSPSMVSMPTNGTCLFLAAGDCADSIPNAIADLQAGGVTISPASLKVAGCALSGSSVTCNGTGFPTNNNPTIDITNGFNNDVHVDNVLGKVDYRFNDRHSINGMYFFGNNRGTVEDFPELQQQWLSDIHTRAQVAGGSWIWAPSTRWVNEARFGYNRLYQPTLEGDLDTPASAYGLNTGVSGPFTGGLPRIGFGGYFFPGLGGFKWPKFQGPDTIIQFIDHVSYTAGKHAFKFGGEIHRDGVTNAAYGNSRGSITFLGGNTPNPLDPTGPPLNTTTLEDFFAGAPLKASVEVGNPTRYLHNWAYAAFAQDDWRVARNLTLNLGLRYEFSSVLQEDHNLLGNFDPNLGMVQVGKQISNIYNPDHTNFGPRMGFAWDIGGNGRTVLRGGGGLIYETVNWQSFIAFNNAFGLGSVPTGAIINASGGTAGGTITTGNITVFPTPPWDNGPIYGNVGTTTINCFNSPCPIMTVDRNFTTPYVWTWTLNLQHAITPNLSLEVAYVGNRGTNLTGIRDINQPPVGSGWPASAITACIASGYTDPVNCAPDSTGGEEANRPFATKFPYLSNIFQMGNIYRSNYDGLQATLNARNYHGLSMVVGYTYSHSLDDVGANWDFGYGSGLPQNAHNPGAEYGNSDFDMRQRFTVSLTYAIPGRKGYGQALEGWEISAIATLQSPQYWGPMDEGTDAAGVGPLPVSPPANSPIRWSFYGSPSDFKSSPNGIPYFSAATNSSCASKALALDGGVAGPSTASLNLFGCYAKGNSIMIPPPLGQFGNMSRNMFPDSGFRNLDFSLAKNWHFGERLRAQFRAEFFNIFNHPNFANPYGGQNGFGFNDPSVFGSTFGCGCATPDVAAANPVIGSGGSRAVQLGLKFMF